MGFAPCYNTLLPCNTAQQESLPAEDYETVITVR